MTQARTPAPRISDADWLRDRVARLLLRRCRLADAGLCSDGSPCATFRRALDHAIVDDLVLLRALDGTTQLGRHLDCSGGSSTTEAADLRAESADGKIVLGEPWLSGFSASDADDAPRQTW